MWGTSPHHSWMTTTPGPFPRSGTDRYPLASRPLLWNDTICPRIPTPFANFGAARTTPRDVRGGQPLEAKAAKAASQLLRSGLAHQARRLIARDDIDARRALGNEEMARMVDLRAIAATHPHVRHP